MGLKKIPGLGTMKIGHFKEPFPLQQLHGTRYMLFMERSLADAFAPGRNTGIMFSNHFLNKRMTWAASGFRQSAATTSDSKIRLPGMSPGD